MSFTENLFPVEVSQGSSGGASFNTDIVTTKSGYEARNANWSQARHRYNVSVGVRGVDDFETLKTFFMAMNGNLQGFRFKDWGDYKSCGITETVTNTDVVIGTGDGATLTYQLIKKYTDGFTYQRTIYKPVSGTVLTAIAGVSANNSTATTTGIITLPSHGNSISNIALGTTTTLTMVSNVNTVNAGDSVYLSGITGTTELNGNRYKILSVNKPGNAYTIDVDSSAFTAYVSGGTTAATPQSGETITAGFEFDVPCRFDSDSMQSRYENFQIFDTDLSVIELRI